MLAKFKADLEIATLWPVTWKKTVREMSTGRARSAKANPEKLTTLLLSRRKMFGFLS